MKYTFTASSEIRDRAQGEKPNICENMIKYQ